MFERRCAHCHEKMYEPYPRQKYHSDCALIVNREKAKAKKQLVKSGEFTQGARSKYDDIYGMINLVENPYEKLAMAIIVRAYIDWKELCDDATLPKDCNFDELEEFFSTGCDVYLQGTSFNGTEILKKLQRERMLAGL